MGGIRQGVTQHGGRGQIGQARSRWQPGFGPARGTAHDRHGRIALRDQGAAECGARAAGRADDVDRARRDGGQAFWLGVCGSSAGEST